MRFYSLMLLACLCVACSQLGCTPSPPPAKKDKIMEETPQGTHANADHTHADPAQADHTHPEQKVAEPTPGESPESVKEEKPAEEPMEEKPAEKPTEEKTAEKPEPMKTEDPAEKPKAEPADEPTAEQKPADESAQANEPEETVEVLLGTAELTSGIPGEGPLKMEEVQKWLENDENHKVLQVKLPLGLSAGQDSIVGLDKSPLTKAKIELGRQLYFDKRLSADSSISCADCHHPDSGYAKDTQFGVGIGGQTGNRNSPASYNRILSGPQFWDGRAASLEEQAKGPIANPIEMGNTHEVCNDTVCGIPAYDVQMKKIYPDGVTIDNIANAIAAFERVLVTNPSPYDYYEPLRVFEEAFADDLEDLEALKEDDPDLYAQYIELKTASDAHPMSESAKRGRTIFFSDKGKCTACHVGANFTDEKYHNLGVGMDAEEPDLGRFAVTGEEKDKGAFKTPTIRNVELTAPYMHDGSQKTLEEVVDWYDKGGHPNPHLDKDMKKLNLTDQEKKDLVEFMKSLTGEFTPVETGRLPEAADET